MLLLDTLESQTNFQRLRHVRLIADDSESVSLQVGRVDGQVFEPSRSFSQRHAVVLLRTDEVADTLAVARATDRRMSVAADVDDDVACVNLLHDDQCDCLYRILRAVS